MTASTPPAPLKPIDPQTLQYLQNHVEDMVETATQQFFLENPNCYQGNNEKLRQICKEDFNHHCRYLFSALATATPEIITNYAVWLKEVLVSRHISQQHLINAFSILKPILNEHLPDSTDNHLVNTVIDAGINALKGNNLFPKLFTQEQYQFPSHTDDYAQALITGNRKQAEYIVNKMQQHGVSLIDIEVGIIQIAMYEIGRLWQLNQITVAQEHLSTAISQHIMARAFSNAEFADPIDKRVLCSCLEGNHHSMGLRMVGDAYEVSGWDVSFLGADTPNNAILSQVDLEKPDVLAISVSLPHQLLTLQQLIAQLETEFAAQKPAIIAGGLAFNLHRQLGSRLKIDKWYLDAKAVLDDLKQ